MAGRSLSAAGSPSTRSWAPENHNIPGAQNRLAKRSGSDGSRRTVPSSRAVEIQKMDHTPIPAYRTRLVSLFNAIGSSERVDFETPGSHIRRDDGTRPATTRGDCRGRIRGPRGGQAPRPGG